MTAKSMWQGWWGLASLVINPITMLTNLGPWKRFTALPEPVPGAPGRPMDPGKPLFRRPAALGVLLPILVIGAIVTISVTTTTPNEARAGDCVREAGTADAPDVEVVDCASAGAQYTVLDRVDSTADDACDSYAEVTASFVVTSRYTNYTLCLADR